MKCVFVLAALVAAAHAATDFVEMEADLRTFEDASGQARLHAPSANWVAADAPPARDAKLVVHVMMRHAPARVAELERVLYAVSDPASPEYGAHLSLDALGKLLPVSDAAVAAVERHLAAADKITWNPNRDMAAVTLSVAAAEAAFRTTLGRFDHARVKGASLLRAVRPYALPRAVAGVVALVGDLASFPRLRGGDETTVVPVAEATAAGAGWPQGCGSSCGSSFITPPVLKQRYGMTSALDRLAAAGAANNSLAVAEFQGQYYDQADLDKFNTNCGTKVAVGKFVGTNDPSACTGGMGQGCIEALLDIEYAGAISGLPLTVIYANGYSLLDWAQQISSMADAPLVHSVSYGNDEGQQVSKAYMQTTNTQFMKAGARGLSILFASGDQGVCGREGCGIGLFGPQSFKPNFPDCPYITSVGGTNFLTPTTIGDESVWNDGGGGMSNNFAIPSFQADVVAAYLANPAADLPPKVTYKGKSYALYNSTGRGYPDVSALGGMGNPYCIVSAGSAMGVAGTSAASPVAASVFAKLNGVRLAAGKAPLGWLNPFVYKNAAAFNDVTHGKNNANYKYGFTAVKGWDPASGVGTPDFAALVKAVQALP